MSIVITSPVEPEFLLEDPVAAQGYFMAVVGLSYEEQCVELSNVMSAKYNLMQPSFGVNGFTEFEQRQALITDLTDRVLLLLISVIGRDPIFAKYGTDLRRMNEEFHAVDEEVMLLSDLNPEEYGHELYTRFSKILGIDLERSYAEDDSDEEINYLQHGGSETEEDESQDFEGWFEEEGFSDWSEEEEHDYDSYDAYIQMMKEEERSNNWLEIILSSQDSEEAEKDYEILVEAPYIVFLLVAFADDEMDKDEINCFADMVINFDRVENKLMANVLRDSISEKNEKMVVSKVEAIIKSKPDYSDKLRKIRNAIETRLSSEEAYRFKKDLILLGFKVASASAGRHSFGRRVCEREKDRIRKIAHTLGVE